MLLISDFSRIYRCEAEKLEASEAFDDNDEESPDTELVTELEVLQVFPFLLIDSFD